MRCWSCEEPILPGEMVSPVEVWVDGRPEPSHRECSLREVMGGIGHHWDHAYWCKEMGDPDGGLTRRESSLLVWQLVTRDPG